MARIAGKEIPDEKKLKISLTYIYGVGSSLAEEIINKARVDGNRLTKDLTPDEIDSIRSVIEKDYQVEGELRQMTKRNIKRLKDIRCYRGIRHKLGLPVRGQRTRHNA
ncbi:MAG TPA: 30S ribosomal protein S13, partial [bacterium]|nr:30S ribosomal protein S13 [bacterium]